MKIEQTRWTEDNGWEPKTPTVLGGAAHLVLVFGGSAAIKRRQGFRELKTAYPNAHLLGCSTAGEIIGTEVLDCSVVCTAIHFEHTEVKGAQLNISNDRNSIQAGERLGQSLPADGLVHVFVLSDGLKVNGSELVEGLVKHLPEGVTVTGGLSGDGSRFSETFVVWDDMPMEGSVAVIGLYGKRLKVGYASLGGWDSFGPERLITKAVKNVLYELDGRSALDLYKNYLGEQANGLPATGLLFPLSIRTKDNTPIVRTILAINEEQQSMTFAGNVPEGSYARLMKANFDRLIDGAAGAARTSTNVFGLMPAELAILISCVGRKLVLGQRIEEEVESVREVLGQHTVMTGFYSYGEISPFTPSAKCELHNQTMTITTLLEQ